MNLKEYSNLINEVFLEEEKKTGIPFGSKVEKLAVAKFLNTPLMKFAYPETNVYHDPNGDDIIMEYREPNSHHKFYGAMDGDVFLFNQKFRSFALTSGLKAIISESDRQSALKIKDALKPESTFKDFLETITVADINKLILVCDSQQADFLKVVKLMKEDQPLNRDFFLKAMKTIRKCNLYSCHIDSYFEDKLYNIAKEGVTDGLDRVNQLRTLLKISDLEASNYSFDDLDEDVVLKAYEKMINDYLPKNSIASLLYHDSKNFIPNVMESLVFETMKKPLAFSMKLISKDVTLEQLYEENPIVNRVFNEALKRDPSLNLPAELFFEHTIVKDKDIYQESNGVGYFNYVEHIVNSLSKPEVMADHFKTDFFRRSYTVIDPELENDVIRFIGKTGPSINYMMCASMEKEATGHHKVLNLDTYLLHKNLTQDQLKDAVHNIIDYCKTNKYILCLDYPSMQHGLNYEEANIIGDIITKAKDKIYAVLLPVDSNKLEVGIKSDVSYLELVANDDKIVDMLFTQKYSVNDVLKSLKEQPKTVKLKM